MLSKIYNQIIENLLVLRWVRFRAERDCFVFVVTSKNNFIDFLSFEKRNAGGHRCLQVYYKTSVTPHHTGVKGAIAILTQQKEQEYLLPLSWRECSSVQQSEYRVKFLKVIHFEISHFDAKLKNSICSFL